MLAVKVPAHRLTVETPPMPQQGLPGPLQLDSDAPADTKRQVYLITFPFPRAARATTGEVLVPSSSMPKYVLLSKLLDAFANPVYANPWQGHGPILLVRLGGVACASHTGGERKA